MSDQTFEIRCPMCKSVVPPDAARCPHCAATPSRKFAAPPRQPALAANASTSGSASASAPATRRPEGFATLPLKDYHRLVRDNHRTITGGRAAGLPGGRFRRRVVVYAPPFILVLGVLLGAAKILVF